MTLGPRGIVVFIGLTIVALLACMELGKAVG